jgi:putative glycosyltransferase (TIGR04348 family)
VKIVVVTPTPPLFNNGNKITAVRLSRILRKLGHKVIVEQHYSGQPCDILIALHARRSANSIQKFKHDHPGLPLVVVLTGTDVYRDIKTDANAQRSLDLATRLVVLQKQALEELPKRYHSKTRVIYQSAEPYPAQPARTDGPFRVCVIGHLRSEKDPLRTAMALRHLPAISKIEVLHVGKALDRELGKQARLIAANNPRYRMAGELPYWMTRRVLARSHLVVITSRMEGGSNVLSEALISSVPVIVSRIPGLIGTLGEDYPGYFPAGESAELARLLLKAELDHPFYQTLKQRCARACALVQPKRESNSWKLLLRELQQWSPIDAPQERGVS